MYNILRHAGTFVCLILLVFVQAYRDFSHTVLAFDLIVSLNFSYLNFFVKWMMNSIQKIGAEVQIGGDQYFIYFIQLISQLRKKTTFSNTAGMALHSIMLILHLSITKFQNWQSKWILIAMKQDQLMSPLHSEKILSVRSSVILNNHKLPQKHETI